uniref:DUF4220 domain-containing protein n=1 Tax=Oryza rufipogon TaxID=4529 RepID=A0A0E0P544_ORYRU
MDKTEAEITRKLINQIRNPQQPMVMWKVMEMELSLLYDILYTKAAVIHTWIGYLIRAMTPVAIVSSFLLFHFSDSKDGQNVVDITVTYILLGGALMMEMTSLLSALGSSWALAFLCAIPWSSLRHAVLCAGRWHRLRRAVVTLRQVVMAMTGGFLGRSRKFGVKVHGIYTSIDPLISVGSKQPSVPILEPAQQLPHL